MLVVDVVVEADDVVEEVVVGRVVEVDVVVADPPVMETFKESDQ